MARIRNEPHVSRVAFGLRDTGYSFPAAVADLVDNSIEAGASHIAITMAVGGDQLPTLNIADNGCGMDADTLTQAMRYGTDAKSDPHRLGRFGLGLNLASTSFARRLLVVTRAEGADGDPISAMWDLDDVHARNAWEMDLDVPATTLGQDLFAEAMAEVSDDAAPSGTVVAWRKAERLLTKKQGSGEYQNPQLAVDRKLKELIPHLGTVFQRYLDPDDSRVRTVTITVNGSPVQPWDPFCENFGIQPVKIKRFTVTNEETGVEDEIVVRDFILPKADEHPVDGYDEYKKTSSSDNQGFYVYREHRLVDGPSWLGLFKNETHQRSHRIELSFPATLDEFFGIPVKKSDLAGRMDPYFEELLTELVAPLRTEANLRDRKGRARDAAAEQSGRNATDVAIGDQREGLTGAEVTSNEDGSIGLRNNRTQGGDPIVILGPDGRPNARFRIAITQDEQQIFVVGRESLEDGVLWAPGYRVGEEGDQQVLVNTGHDWYRKAYLPNLKENPNVCEAIDFLLYALALAELNNTDEDLRDDFEQFRVEVSRNLRRLVADMLDHDD